MINYLKGFATGLMAGFPAGPLGAIVLREMIRGEIKQGFLKGMGAVTVNFLYGLIVTLGVSFVSGFLLKYQDPIRLAGAIFIILLGLNILRPRKKDAPAKPLPTAVTSGASYLTGLVVTATNPAKIFIYTGMISFWGLDSVSTGGPAGALLLAAGIASGSLFWWIVAALGLAKIKQAPGSRRSLKLNLFFGTLIILLGLYFLISTVIKLRGVSSDG